MLVQLQAVQAGEHGRMHRRAQALLNVAVCMAALLEAEVVYIRPGVVWHACMHGTPAVQNPTGTEKRWPAFTCQFDGIADPAPLLG